MLLEMINPALSSQNGGFTYNDSPYVHALNRALQLEHAAIALYSACIRENMITAALVSERCNKHSHAIRDLVRMIFAQRGLPDSTPASFTAVTSTLAAKASKWIPNQLLGASAHRIESTLWERYQAIIEIAPPQDKECLIVLLEQARDFSLESL